MNKLKITYLLSSFFVLAFLTPVLFTTSTYADHGGWHSLPDPDTPADEDPDSLPDVDKECAKKGEDTSFGWGGTDDCAEVGDLVSTIFKVLAGIVGVAVVGGIAWGGMLYTTSNGNASKSQQGITAIVNSVIGLLLFIFMFALTNFIVPGGIL